MRKASRSLTVALGLAALATGCGRGSKEAPRRRDAAIDAGPPAPRATTMVLDAVAVELHGRADGVLDARALGRSFARCLIESGAPVVPLEEQAPPGEVVRHLSVTLAITVHEATADRADVGVTLDATGRWADDEQAPAPAASLTGAATPRRAPTAGVDPASAATVAVVLELEPKLCGLYGGRLQTWAADDLRPALSSEDPAGLAWALAVARDRPPPDDAGQRGALLDAIAPHLASAEPAVRDAAIAALVALGDARAVPRLTATADLGDEATLVRLIDAIARLGGEDARDFLQVLTSHRAHRVARAARLGLAALAIDDRLDAGAR